MAACVGAVRGLIPSRPGRGPLQAIPFNHAMTMTMTNSIPAGSAAERPTKSFARHIPAVVRLLMGIPFFVFGLNGFLNFIPPPSTPLPAGAAAFTGALVNTGYMMKLIGGTQLIVGGLLVANRFVPFALVFIAPFLVNALAFHLALEPTGLPIVAIFCAMELFLVYAYRKAYGPILTARSSPA
jgi:hypothetical protein